MKKSLLVLNLFIGLNLAVPAVAADNNFTNFTIREVFSSHTLMLTDGIIDIALTTGKGCSFSDEDKRQQLVILESESKGNNQRDKSNIQSGDHIKFNNQTCKVVFKKEGEYIFYRFTVTQIETGDPYTSVTGSTPDGMNYTLNIPISDNDTPIQVGETFFLDGLDYEPEQGDRLYRFYEYTDETYWYEIYRISSATHTSGTITKAHPLRIGFWGAQGTSIEDFQPNQEYVMVVNRTREIISTRKWTLVNSLGTSVSIPTLELRTNQRLKIKMGQGENGRVSPLVKKVFLDLSESFIHPGVEWVKILNKDNQVIMTYDLP